jgi:uncharacterized protein (TIGR03435 family)
MTPVPEPKDGKVPAGVTSLDRLTALLGSLVDRPVVDKSGLNGFFRAAWNQDALNAESLRMQRDKDSGPVAGVFDAVKKQLGLELKPAKDPFEVLVIDSAQKPSPN